MTLHSRKARGKEVLSVEAVQRIRGDHVLGDETQQGRRIHILVSILGQLLSAYSTDIIFIWRIDHEINLSLFLQ